jgi:hypothetical protein
LILESFETRTENEESEKCELKIEKTELSNKRSLDCDL